MSNYTLTAVDTTGIQRYLFSTNNLRQNAGASHLVAQATGKWVEDALPKPHNVCDIDDWVAPFTGQTIDDGLAAEVIYAGGGNIVIIFCDKDTALQFTRDLTKRVLFKAPGLQVAVTHLHKNDLGPDAPKALGGARGLVQDLMVQLAEQKRAHSPVETGLGLGVTSSCVFTGLPAAAYDKDQRPVSDEAKAKEDAAPASLDRLKRVLKFDENTSWQIPLDFEDMGSTRDESSYIGVVHADGNRMGRRILDIQKQYPTAKQNRDYIDAMRKFSLAVNRAAIESLQETVNLLTICIQERPQITDAGVKITYHIAEEIELKSDRGGPYLPFRPIVFGGDDLTFVCDGRLGLSLASYYLSRFADKILPDGGHAHCRAGIAVVHTHYPFARAYALAEDLCKSAKKSIKEWEADAFEDGVTAMDWHFAVGGMIHSLDKIRRREYTSDAGLRNMESRADDLLMRPVRINEPEIDWRSWQTLTNLVSEFNTNTWSERRNKVLALRTVLRKGVPEAVERFRHVYIDGEPLPNIPNMGSMAKQGWQGNQCGYFDAIEAMDFFVDLQRERGKVEAVETIGGAN